jgi:predicted TIM-barrel fold metal-dependent hydrolase
MSTPILAHHAHVFPEAVNPKGSIDRLLHLLDDCGIDQAVCFAPFVGQMGGTGDPVQWLAAELRRRGNDRLFGFGTVDLTRTDLRDQVRRIRDAGFRGIKLHPNVQEFDILGDAALQVYAAAEAEDLFLTFHSGVHHYRIAHYNVLKFDEVAYGFPRLRLSLEHVGGYSFFADALAVIVNNIPFPPVPGKRARVFGGLTSVFTRDFLRFWFMDDARMREAISQAGASQFIFGLDFPYNLEENTKTALATIRNLGLSAEDQALILGGNLRRELGYPLPGSVPTVAPIAASAVTAIRA